MAEWGGGGGRGSGWLPTSTFSLILGPRRNVRSKEFLMDRCPKDEPVAKHLVYRKSSSHSPEKVEKPGWRGGGGGGVDPSQRFRKVKKVNQSLFYYFQNTVRLIYDRKNWPWSLHPQHRPMLGQCQR